MQDKILQYGNKFEKYENLMPTKKKERKRRKRNSLFEFRFQFLNPQWDFSGNQRNSGKILFVFCQILQIIYFSLFPKSQSSFGINTFKGKNNCQAKNRFETIVMLLKNMMSTDHKKSMQICQLVAKNLRISPIGHSKNFNIRLLVMESI